MAGRGKITGSGKNGKMGQAGKKPASGKKIVGGPKIKIVKDGPYLVSGSLPLQKEYIEIDKKGEAVRWSKGQRYPKQETYALCRCGKSVNKPYCTGTHAEVGFFGKETATEKRYLDQSERTSGPKLDLTDAVSFCASGRFCDRGKGTWQLTRESDDPKARKMAVDQACNCPSGRLVAWDKKSGKPAEPKSKKSISLAEDPQAQASGPIWVKGGVLVESADGKAYEIRNRVTLCRCGSSENKPFCDGTHMRIRFNDGDKRVKR